MSETNAAESNPDPRVLIGLAWWYAVTHGGQMSRDGLAKADARLALYYMSIPRPGDLLKGPS